MLKSRQIVTLAGIALSLGIVHQVQAATVNLVPDKDQVNNPGKMNVRSIDDLAIVDPNDPRLSDPNVDPKIIGFIDFYNVTFAFEPFNTVFGTPPANNNPIPPSTPGASPCTVGLCFWSNSARAAIALTEINDEIETVSPDPTEISVISGSVPPIPGLNPVERNFYRVPITFDINNLGLIQAVEGSYNGTEWIETIVGVPSVSPTSTTMYASFAYLRTEEVRVPEPSNLIGIFVIGASLLFLTPNLKKNTRY